MRHLTSTLLILATVLSAHAQSPSPANADRPSPLTPPTHCKPWEPMWGYWKDAPVPWPQMHWNLVDKVAAKKGNLDVIFLGDSITAGWSNQGAEIFGKEFIPLKSVGIGVGGDTTRQILWRLDHKAMDGTRPKVVVLMIGVNNIFAKVDSDEDIRKGVETVIAKIHSISPSTKILLLSVLPMAGTKDALNERVKSVNAELAKLAGDKVKYFDLYSSFVGPDGKAIAELYKPDFVHLAVLGYAKWSEVMKPTLIELLK